MSHISLTIFLFPTVDPIIELLTILFRKPIIYLPWWKWFNCLAHFVLSLLGVILMFYDVGDGKGSDAELWSDSGGLWSRCLSRDTELRVEHLGWRVVKLESALVHEWWLFGNLCICIWVNSCHFQSIRSYNHRFSLKYRWLNMLISVLGNFLP